MPLLKQMAYCFDKTLPAPVLIKEGLGSGARDIATSKWPRRGGFTVRFPRSRHRVAFSGDLSDGWLRPIPHREAPPMNPHYLPATARDDVPAWQQTVVAFLAEKERRSGSRRTVETYARMLWPFLNRSDRRIS